MRGNSAPLLLFSSVLAVLMLAGCVTTPIYLDPLSVEGRDGGGPIPTYAMLMRIGAAAQSGGDLPDALGVYRRAAELAPQDPAPLIAAGDVLVQMGNINEAIVSYNAALVRPGDTQGAQVGLARAFLKLLLGVTTVAEAVGRPDLVSRRPRPRSRASPGPERSILPCRSPISGGAPNAAVRAAAAGAVPHRRGAGPAALALIVRLTSDTGGSGQGRAVVSTTTWVDEEPSLSRSLQPTLAEARRRRSCSVRPFQNSS